MIEELPQSNQFRQQLRHSLQQETLDSPTITIAKNAQVYNRGDSDGLVYFIESGQVKLLMVSPEDRECLLAIHTAGDIFGELCLSGVGIRRETATAMEETVLRQIPCSKVFCEVTPRCAVCGGLRAVPRGADCRPAAGHRQSDDCG